MEPIPHVYAVSGVQNEQGLLHSVSTESHVSPVVRVDANSFEREECCSLRC
eukprot:COSAG02_NODE_23366_length_721_cov_0.744373_1_plen_50_part_01